MQDRFLVRVWKKNCYADGRGEFTEPFAVQEGYPIYADGTKWQEGSYIIQQCSGLKDKNGKLIYEGDILKYPYSNKYRIGFVEYSKSLWCVSKSNFVQGAYSDGALVNLYDTSEVIGNIYENPELLKSKLQE